jgi:hypothetical protein
LNVFLFKVADSITESVGFDRSAAGIGARVKPKDDDFIAVIGEFDLVALVV